MQHMDSSSQAVFYWNKQEASAVPYAWEDIELDWKAGILSVSEMCAKHFISESRLRKVSKDRGWVRAPKSSVVVPIASCPHTLKEIQKIYEDKGPAGAAVRFGAPVDNMSTLGQDEGWSFPQHHAPSAVPGASWETSYTEEDVRKAGLLASATVLSCHRRDVTQLRSLTTTMIKGLSDLLSDEPTDNPIPVIGAKESVADVLGKLTIIMERVINMERQAYGLQVESQRQDEVDAYAKMDPTDRRRKIDELIERTSKMKAR